MRDWLAGIAAAQQELRPFLEDLFTRLSGLLEEFLRRQQAWESQRRKLEEQFEARSAELDQQRAELAAQRQRLQAAGDGEASPVPNLPEELVCRAVEELQQQRKALQEATAAAEARAAQWLQAAAELQEAREAFRQQTETWKNLQKEFLEPGSAQELESQLRAIQQQQLEWERERARWVQERAALEQERIVLEKELETVRSRAAELSEGLNQQARHIADQREQWGEELKRIRRLVETISQRQLAPQPADPRTPVGPVAVPAGAPRAPLEESHSDPVLDSVITQFEMLQRDLARRRRAAAAG
ncbi:MAG: hypothetical protein ACUVUC_12210 [Thermoguttaceae bacterium]